jgi:hypothetical protein
MRASSSRTASGEGVTSAFIVEGRRYCAFTAERRAMVPSTRKGWQCQLRGDELLSSPKYRERRARCGNGCEKI